MDTQTTQTIDITNNTARWQCLVTLHCINENKIGDASLIIFNKYKYTVNN